MSALRMIFYGRTEITGKDLNRFEVGRNVNALISPDNVHVLRIESSRFANSTQLQIKNNYNVAFLANIVNANSNLIAQMYYNGHNSIIINNRWVINQAFVQCRNLVLGAALPDPIMRIRLHNHHFEQISRSRIDIQLNGGNFAAVAINSDSELFVRFNGNYVYNRWGLMINRAIEQLVEDRFQRHQPAIENPENEVNIDEQPNEAVNAENLLVIDQEPIENVAEHPNPENEVNIDEQPNEAVNAENLLVIDQEPIENVAEHPNPENEAKVDE